MLLILVGENLDAGAVSAYPSEIRGHHHQLNVKPLSSSSGHGSKNLVLSTTSGQNHGLKMQKNDTQNRHLQPGKKFQARYSGWFQVRQDINCMGPAPVIRATCGDGGAIEVEGTVPSSGITCSDPQNDVTSKYRDYVDCVSSPQVYLNQNQSYNDGS
jgi:hypothetical protein